MSANGVNKTATGVPEGYVALPLSSPPFGVLRLCALVRGAADPVDGHLVRLRRGIIDADVVLGCVTDAGGKVREWLELWVQQPAALAALPPALQEISSNALLDARWRATIAAFESAEGGEWGEAGKGGELLRTGWELAHPPPLFLDLKKGTAVELIDPSTKIPWRLCEDDALLTSKGLPAYTGSLHRYLYLAGGSDQVAFIPLTAEAPTNALCRSPADVLAAAVGEAVGFNPGGGFVVARTFSPIQIDELADVIGGATWQGINEQGSTFDPGNIHATLNAQDADGRLLQGESASLGKLQEALHLKLRLLSDAVRSVSGMIRQTQRPLLNLSAGSFQVRFGPAARGLPFLWTSSAGLVDPGQAIHLALPGSDVPFYLYSPSDQSSAYRPAVDQVTRGVGSVRIPKLTTESDGMTVVDLTLVSQEDLNPGRRDLAIFRLKLNSGVAQVYARPDPDTTGGASAGEWKFHGIRQRFKAEALTGLRGISQGRELSGVRFDIIPLLSSPCDLYALGVLAVRLLLTNRQTTLAVALDKVRTLSNQLLHDSESKQPLRHRVAGMFQKDASWFGWLGPQLLAYEPISPDDAYQLLPMEIWWEVLAMIVRMFPGEGLERPCRDFGDAPDGALHKVFTRAEADLESLLRRTRSLLVVDWRLNREVDGVLKNCLLSLTH